jgi:glycosyltransferase involved in cell wall biosynthesis
VFLLKIFQVVPYYPPHIGGMEFYVQRLSEELAARGHEITVFTSSSGKLESVREVNGVKIVSLRKMLNVYNVPIVPSLFWRLLNQERPDVIDTHQYPVFFSDVSAGISWIKNVPLLLHVHVVSYAKSPFSGFVSDAYYSTIGRIPFEVASSIVSPSMAYRNKLIQMGAKPNKIQVIPYGIDLQRFALKYDVETFKAHYDCKNSKVILSVGRLNYQKGFQYLIKAMPGIIRRFPNAKLMIVGEGEQLAYLEQLSKSLGVGESVIFTGALSQTEIPKAYAACDVFVLPSLFEALGISLIEAQAAGKPVVGTRSEGAIEALIENETGFLVNPCYTKGLEEAIEQILSDSSLASAMGEKGKKYANVRFSIQNSVNSIIDTYSALAC